MPGRIWFLHVVVLKHSLRRQENWAAEACESARSAGEHDEVGIGSRFAVAAIMAVPPRDRQHRPAENGLPRRSRSAGPTGVRKDAASWTTKHRSTNQGHDVIESIKVATNHIDPLQEAVDWPRPSAIEGQACGCRYCLRARDGVRIGGGDLRRRHRWWTSPASTSVVEIGVEMTSTPCLRHIVTPPAPRRVSVTRGGAPSTQARHPLQRDSAHGRVALPKSREGRSAPILPASRRSG